MFFPRKKSAAVRRGQGIFRRRRLFFVPRRVRRSGKLAPLVAHALFFLPGGETQIGHAARLVGAQQAQRHHVLDGARDVVLGDVLSGGEKGVLQQDDSAVQAAVIVHGHGQAVVDHLFKPIELLHLGAVLDALVQNSIGHCDSSS